MLTLHPLLELIDRPPLMQLLENPNLGKKAGQLLARAGPLGVQASPPMVKQRKEKKRRRMLLLHRVLGPLNGKNKIWSRPRRPQ
jgi:hypothetical protein